MNNIYHLALMDHYRNPRNRYTLEEPDFAGEQENAYCADKVHFAGKLCAATKTISELAFSGQGCVLSQAIASMISEQFILKPIEQVFMGNDENFVCALAGSPLGPTRLKCALLGLKALQQAIATYKERNA